MSETYPLNGEYYVYTWTRPDTGAVFYVGKGKGDRDRQLKGRNRIFRNIVSKLERLGLEPVISRVAEGLTEEEAFAAERDEILIHGRINNRTGTLSNLTDGGEGASGAVVSDETKRKKSLSVKETLSDPVVRKKISDAVRRRYENPEERQRQSERSRERYKDPAERLKNSIPLRGVPKTSEHKSAVVDALRPLWESGEMGDRIRKVALLRGPGPRNKSGYKGVSFDKSSGKWMAQVEVGGRNKHLGRYLDPVDAARAYDTGVVKYYGE